MIRIPFPAWLGIWAVVSDFFVYGGMDSLVSSRIHALFPVVPRICSTISGFFEYGGMIATIFPRILRPLFHGGCDFRLQNRLFRIRGHEGSWGEHEESRDV